MRKQYLQEHRKPLFHSLLLSGETVSPPAGRDRQDSEQADGANNDRFAESTDPPDKMTDQMEWVELHEQSESTGRGNDTGGTYIQLTLFPSEQEQIQRIAGKERINKPFAYSAFLCHKNQMDSILRTGNNKG